MTIERRQPPPPVPSPAIETMGLPRITVLMPVYNGEPYLHEAIDSILQQSFADFEFLIIDDGSTDRSAAIVESYDDPRIRLVSNERNLGLVLTLNRGLELCRGEYIARMDSDDIALPSRLRKQLDFLDKNPEIGLCGTWSRRFHGGHHHLFTPPTEDTAIRFQLIFDNVFYHNTIMMRRQFLHEYGLTYDASFQHAEDYEFWVRCSKYTKVANLPEILVLYRFHPDNTSNRHAVLQRETSDRIRLMQLDALALNPGVEELAIHFDLLNLRVRGELDRLLTARKWFKTLANELIMRHGITQKEIDRVFSHFWYGACGNFAHTGIRTWLLFLSEPYGRHARLEYILKLLVRCVLKKDILREPAD